MDNISLERIMETTTDNLYLLQENPKLLDKHTALLMSNDNHGFFLLGRIKNFTKIKAKTPKQAANLNPEIVTRLQSTFPDYNCSIINDKIFT